jgi:hypothetical protein
MVFESALSVQTGSAAAVDKKEPLSASSQSQVENPIVQSAPADSRLQSWPALVAVLAAGLAALFVLAFVRRKNSAQ